MAPGGSKGIFGSAAPRSRQPVFELGHEAPADPSIGTQTHAPLAESPPREAMARLSPSETIRGLRLGSARQSRADCCRVRLSK
jgi:hypothetical protein